MIVMFMRSSSAGSWSMCQMKYYLSYVLGYREEPNQKTIKGSICHKCLELMARKKLAEQNGEIVFTDEETGTFSCVDIDLEKALEIAWKHYTDDDKKNKWKASDLRDCRDWIDNVVNFNDGMFYPLKRTIVRPEQYFEFEIDEPWAKYDFKIKGKTYKGNLVVKGTIDLLTKTKNGIFEMIDWKTGARLDWATGKEKDYEKILMDFQLRLYHYALSKLYPELDLLLITIFFLKDGGPYSFHLDRSDLSHTIEMIKSKFEEIKNKEEVNVIYPGMITMPDGYRMSSCEKFCAYRKVTLDGSKADSYNDSICHQVHSELQELGMKKITDKYVKVEEMNKYSGGGKENVESATKK